jgi:hypothetical protein
MSQNSVSPTPMHIRDRSYRSYDYREVVATQDDVPTQIVKWYELAYKFNPGTPEYCKSIAKVAYWKSVQDAQARGESL